MQIKPQQEGHESKNGDFLRSRRCLFDSAEVL
jgi:hypothetical protein